MKIALVAFPIHPSHGCILQTFALRQILCQAGHDVTIIDRQWDRPKLISLCKERLKCLYKKMTNQPAYLKTYAQQILMSQLFSFIDTQLPNRKIYYKNPTFNDFLDFDAFIVGSDQTWRPKYVSDITCYYLGFVPKEARVKRIAYAPSFGTEDWEYSSELTAFCRELIQRFDAVSVREESGVQLCREHYGIDATHILDPTMLLDKSDYLKTTGVELKENDILSYYLLDNSESKISLVNKICGELHLKSQRVNTETENSAALLSERIAPSIEKWIAGFAHSKFIIADSFHAMVFAILFNKPFLIIANPHRGLARFESILKKLGLESRMVFYPENVSTDILCKSIDWTSVNMKLQEERIKSKRFIISALMKVKP